MNIIGLGKTGCSVANKFSKYPQYNIFKIGIEEGNVEEQNHPELYEQRTNVPKFNLDGPIDFILSGDELIIGASLKILESYKDHEIRIIYIKPSQKFLTDLQKTTNRIVYKVLQEYTRSNKFKSMFLVNYEEVSKMVGKIPIVGYYEKLNSVIADTFHMINYLEHNEPVMDTFSECSTTYCIKTIGLMKVNEAKESLFCELDEIRDKRYYYCINDKQLENDGDLLDKINDQVLSKSEEYCKTMFGVYSSQYEENYCYIIHSSPHIQD